MTTDEYDGEKLESMHDVWQPLPKYKTFGGKLFYVYCERKCFWFRFFDGYGLFGKSQKIKDFELFSERNGYRKFVKLFGWKFRLLKPRKP
jgi:hypothetical protein